MSTEPQNPQGDDSARIGMGMMMLMWLVLLALLSSYFWVWGESERNPNKNVLNTVSSEGMREVVLQRNRYGHYVASGEINGEEVEFMLDTGASDISIPMHVAKRLGLKRGAVMTYQTAKGPAQVYVTRLDSVALGNIELKNVRGSINPNVRDNSILLGMAFLKHIEFTQRGDTLTLRQY